MKGRYIMTNNELIDRYVYAVSAQLPGSIRNDVDKELRTAISDMLDERCDGMTPSENDVKVVLTELGDPSELALKYDPRGERWLIGPKYYRSYFKVLTIVLIANTCALILAGIVSAMAGESSGAWYSIAAEWLNNIWNTALAVFAVVTIVFAVLEYKKVNIGSNGDLMNLPPVPEKNEKISRVDSIIGIFVGAIILVVFLFAPQWVGLGVMNLPDGGSRFVSLFNVPVVKDLWFLFVVSFGASIANDCFKLIVARYNIKVAIVNAVCEAVTIIMSAFILLRSDIVNPQISELVSELDVAPEDVEVVSGIFSHLNVLIFGLIAVFGLISIVVTTVKGIKYSKAAK